MIHPILDISWVNLVHVFKMKILLLEMQINGDYMKGLHWLLNA